MVWRGLLLAALLAGCTSGGPSRQGLSATASTSLSTAYARAGITRTSAVDAASKDVPEVSTLELLDVELDTIVSATSLTWYLSRDSGGDIPITQEVTSTIVSQGATGTDGGVASKLQVLYVQGGADTVGNVYFNGKLDAGTANGIGRLSWRTP